MAHGASGKQILELRTSEEEQTEERTRRAQIYTRVSEIKSAYLSAKWSAMVRGVRVEADYGAAASFCFLTITQLAQPCWYILIIINLRGQRTMRTDAATS